LVIGVARGGQRKELLHAGADIVVSDLGEIALDKDKASPGAGGTGSIPLAREALARLLERRNPAVFLDYDGTLTPIVARPDLALLSNAMRGSVRRLARLCPVAIISGRDRADVEQLVGLEELVYAGSHGFDIAGPGGLRIEHEEGAAFVAAVERASEMLQTGLKGVSGAIIEPKRFAVAVHYRQVAELGMPAVEAEVNRVVKAVPELRKTHGKKVFELRPRFDWDKGKAVMWLLRALGLNGPETLPFYLGDDTTDEDAFRALKDRGVGIFVGQPDASTAAIYRLEDSEAVGDFLNTLSEMLERRDG
jgi:alpha,alpha-trehalase